MSGPNCENPVSIRFEITLGGWEFSNANFSNPEATCRVKLQNCELKSFADQEREDAGDSQPCSESSCPTWICDPAAPLMHTENRNAASVIQEWIKLFFADKYSRFEMEF